MYSIPLKALNKITRAAVEIKIPITEMRVIICIIFLRFFSLK